MADIGEEYLKMLEELDEEYTESFTNFFDGYDNFAEFCDRKKKGLDIVANQTTLANEAKLAAGSREERRKEAEKVCESIRLFLDKRKCKYSEVTQEEVPIYIINIYLIDFITITLRMLVEFDQGCIRFDTSLPIACKRQNYVILSYKLANLNKTLRFGTFYVDREENEILYRYDMAYDARSFDVELCGFIIRTIIRTVYKYYREIAGYAHAKLSEEEKNIVLKAIKDNVQYLINN